VAVLPDSTLAKLGGDPTNSLTGSIVAKTGQLKVTFGNGNGAATTQGLGAVLQDQNTAGGFFLTATNAGALLLQP
jgi:glycerol kinase